jgi:hypothetical protein
VERIWRREGLKVAQKQPKRGRLWLNDGSCVRATLPFPVPLGGVLLLLVLFPEIALWLPGRLFGD